MLTDGCAVAFAVSLNVTTSVASQSSTSMDDFFKRTSSNLYETSNFSPEC